MTAHGRMYAYVYLTVVLPVLSEDGNKGGDNEGGRMDVQCVKWRLIKSFAATSGG